MEETMIDKDALKEIYVILNKLGLYDKIPIEFQKYIEINKNDSHQFDFNEAVPLIYQVNNKTTSNLITYIFIKYINSSKINKKYIEKEIIEILNNNS